MAYIYTARRKEAERIASVIEAAGYIPTIFRDGNIYRVQCNDVGFDWLVHHASTQEHFPLTCSCCQGSESVMPEEEE